LIPNCLDVIVAELIKEMETWLYFIRFWKNKTKEKYEDASNFINQAFETVSNTKTK